MKLTYLTIFFVLYFLPVANSQSYTDSVIQRQSYLFENFIDGSVLLKSGEISRAPLNYCSYDQTVLFKKDGKILTLTGLASVDTVYINEKKFVPFNDMVYEVINTTGKVELYVSYVSEVRPLIATADHNGTSVQDNNQVSNTVSNVYVSRPFKGDFTLEITKRYWLKMYKKLYKANNVKDFLKVFRESTNPSIGEFVKQNHIDFKSEADLVKLINFCNEQ